MALQVVFAADTLVFSRGMNLLVRRRYADWRTFHFITEALRQAFHGAFQSGRESHG